MKKLFFVVGIFSAAFSYAQKDGKIILNKGQQITIVSASSSDTDMGMGMSMKTDNTTTNILSVIAVDDKNYSITNTTTKLKMSMDMMGESNKYDSEKPEDKSSDMGKAMSEKLNITDTAFVDKLTGNTVTNSKKTSSPERPAQADDANPFEGILSSMGGNREGDAIVEGTFFIIPKDKKVGDSWTDSSTENNMTSKKTFKIKSIEKDIATITVTGSISGDGVTEMQGTSISFHIDTKSIGEILVDVKKCLVNKNTNEVDMTATMDVMGQSMPISSKGNFSVTYQY
ncbi:MAG: DUF6263 family protein [Ferruginibacter sp.]